MWTVAGVKKKESVNNTVTKVSVDLLIQFDSSQMIILYLLTHIEYFVLFLSFHDDGDIN